MKKLAILILTTATVALNSSEALAQIGPQRTQVRFAGPNGMQVRWWHRNAEGKEEFSKVPLEVPARFNFMQGGTYRLKLSHLPGFPGLELYPTLQTPIPSPAARDYLAHNSVQLEMTGEEIRDVLDGKQLTKTLYLPGSPVGPATTLLILRIGNIDFETPDGKK